MGIVFGVTGSKEPAYQILKQTAAYEIRRYPKIHVAEWPMAEDGGQNNGFRELAKYIGVMGDPANEIKKPMAMTAPVLMTAAESNVVSKTARTMSFVLPFELERTEIPAPTNKKIAIKVVDEQTVAVVQFSGWYTAARGEGYFREMARSLKDDGVMSDIKSDDWMVAQYHPPFTIPFLRRNEVWIPLPDYNTDA